MLAFFMFLKNKLMNENIINFAVLGHGSNAVTRAPAVRLNDSISL